MGKGNPGGTTGKLGRRQRDTRQAWQREAEARRISIAAAWAARHPSAAREQRRLRKEQAEKAERWGHKNAGTVETHAAAATHNDAFEQLERNGTITKEQHEWADEIDNVHRSIVSDVSVSIASLEARVDNSSRGADRVAENIRRVRLHHAYSIWRDALPRERPIIFEMIMGHRVGYSVAARRYGMHARKAKRLLLTAIDLWPDCVARSFQVIDRAIHLALNSGQPIDLPEGWRDPARSVAAVMPRALWTLTDDPAERPGPSTVEVDPAFIDERGLFRSWEEIADIVRHQAMARVPDEAGSAAA